MRYLLILLYSLLFPILALGQDVVVTGVVKTEGGQPIPYATIKFKQAGKGTVANDNGGFVLKISPGAQKDTIEFSSMGFEHVTLAVTDINVSNKLNIGLKEEYYDLPETQVEADGLENIIRKAIGNIPGSFQSQAYSYPIFYRQHHLENEECVRLIEVAFEVHDPGYVYTTAASQQERLKLLEMRKSKVYEMNNGQHGNHLADLILENSVHYRIGTVLNEKALSFFEFSRPKDEDLGADTKQIQYSYKNPKDEKVVRGKLWLEGEECTINRIEETTYPNIEYSGPWARNTGGYDWIFREGRKVVQYKKVEGKMYLDSISFYYKHDLIHPTFHNIDYTVEEYFEIWAGEPRLVVPQTLPIKEFKKSYDLYGKRYQYHPTFWESYSLYQQHPLESKAIKELEWKMPLEEQFMKKGID